jgi:hypothetical protein
VSFTEAKRRHVSGEAFVIVFPNSFDKYVENTLEIVEVRKRPRPPCYEGVLPRHIFRAFGCGGESGNDSARKRIDCYGELARFGGVASWRLDVLEAVDSLARDWESRCVTTILILEQQAAAANQGQKEERTK